MSDRASAANELRTAGLSRAEQLDGTGYDGFDWIYAAKLPD
jgi:hypothetical protein